MNIKNKTPIYFINITLFVLISIGVALAAIYIKPEILYSVSEKNGNEESLIELTNLHNEQIVTNKECADDVTDSHEISPTAYDIEPNKISIIDEHTTIGIENDRLSLNEISIHSIEKSETVNNEECDLKPKIFDESSRGLTAYLLLNRSHLSDRF